MFNDISELEANKDNIMGIMRSSMVCLYVLLKNIDIVKQSTSLIKTKDICIKSTIVNQLEAILFSQEQLQFRQDFMNALCKANMHAEANIFNERLEIATNLPDDTKNKTRGLLSMLSTGEKWFVDWLWSFMGNEHESTQEAGAGLIADYFPWLDPYFHDSSDDEQEEINYYSQPNKKDSRLLTFSKWLSSDQQYSLEPTDTEQEFISKKVKHTI